LMPLTAGDSNQPSRGRVELVRKRRVSRGQGCASVGNKGWGPCDSVGGPSCCWYLIWVHRVQKHMEATILGLLPDISVFTVHICGRNDAIRPTPARGRCHLHCPDPWVASHHLAHQQHCAVLECVRRWVVARGAAGLKRERGPRSRGRLAEQHIWGDIRPERESKGDGSVCRQRWCTGCRSVGTCGDGRAIACGASSDVIDEECPIGSLVHCWVVCKRPARRLETMCWCE
jgi:hypothetical protein